MERHPEKEREVPAARSLGKRRHPDYEQVTAYIRRSTHHQVKLALLRETRDRQFSELVEELLCGWLKSHR